jgi:hypothetical protein
LLCIVFSLRANSQEFIIDVSEAFNIKSDKQQIETLLSDLYLPLGIKPYFVYYPSLRGLNLVNKGSIDAEAFRFDSVANLYPNPWQTLIAVFLFEC